MSQPIGKSLQDVRSLSEAICEEKGAAQVLEQVASLAARWSGGDHVDLVLDEPLARRLARGGKVSGLQSGDAASHWILERGEPLIVSGLDASVPGLELALKDERYKSYLGVPIISGDRVCGALYVRNLESRRYDQDEVDGLLALADLAGIALAQEKMRHRLDEHHRTMVRFALADPLTNLASQRHFDHVLKREWRRAQAEVFPLSLLKLEIDAFGEHEGRVGALQGRETLVGVARILERALYRPNDLVARFEHGSFGVLLPDTDQSGAQAIARRLVKEVAAVALPHPHLEGRTVRLSVGVASHEPLAVGQLFDGPEELVVSADEALEGAQTVGGDGVVGQV